MSVVPNEATSFSPVRSVRSRWIQAIFALMVFLGGVACGASITGHLVMRSVHDSLQHPETISDHITDRLSRVLDLNDAQKRQVRKIIIRRHESLSEIRRDIQPRIERELDILENEIDAILDDDQRVEWHKHLEQFRHHWLPPAPMLETANQISHESRWRQVE